MLRGFLRMCLLWSLVQISLGRAASIIRLPCRIHSGSWCSCSMPRLQLISFEIQMSTPLPSSMLCLLAMQHLDQWAPKRVHCFVEGLSGRAFNIHSALESQMISHPHLPLIATHTMNSGELPQLMRPLVHDAPDSSFRASSSPSLPPPKDSQSRIVIRIKARFSRLTFRVCAPRLVRG